jgi:DNA-directed RNA polymerase II subunit RPB2
MIDLLRASLEEVETIRTRDDALDYIAKRGPQSQHNLDRRIRYALLLLKDDFLPHVSQDANGSLKKAYFVGYMVNRLLQASLGRATEDDRDHYGKKRLDMAGTLMAGLFRQLFRQYVEDMTKQIKKEIKDSNRKDVNL